jgi:hypothetical protein
VATSQGNRQLESVRWEQSVAVQQTLQSKLVAVEARNGELEAAAARLFGELEAMKAAGDSSSLEARLREGEQMLSSINDVLTDLEDERDAEVAELLSALEDCQAETRRLQFEQQAERRETAELLAELAAGEEASAELHCAKLQEIEDLHRALSRSEDERMQLENEQAAERREHTELVAELAGDAEDAARLHAGSLREIEQLHGLLRKERDERQRLIVGELAELTEAKTRLQQLAAEKQQLLSVRSLEQAAHSAELEKVHTAHATELAELRSALAKSEAERKRLVSSAGQQHVEGGMILREQGSSARNTAPPKPTAPKKADPAAEAEEAEELLARKMVAKQASMIVALKEQLEANKAEALKDKQAAVKKIRSKAQNLIKQNGAERREAEAQIAELKAQLQRQQLAA